MPWTVRRVCANTNCNRMFTAPDGSMRRVCSWCIKYDRLTGRVRDKRDTYLLRTYNLSPGEYEHLLSMQGGACAICHLPPRRGTRLHVDHDHTGLKVRGLLCTACNTKLGWLEKHSAAISMYLRGR